MVAPREPPGQSEIGAAKPPVHQWALPYWSFHALLYRFATVLAAQLPQSYKIAYQKMSECGSAW